MPLSTVGPHFSEFLSLQVGDDCSVTVVCKVNTGKLNDLIFTHSKHRAADLWIVDSGGLTMLCSNEVQIEKSQNYTSSFLYNAKLTTV